MKLLSFLLVFYFTVLHAEPLLVDANFVTQMSGEYQRNYEDTNKTFTPEMVASGSDLKRYPQHMATYSKSDFWSTFEIHNASDKPTAIVLRNLRAGTDRIDVHLYRNGTYSETILLGDLRPQDQRMMLSPKSVFYLVLAPRETINVVTRFECLGSYDLQWEISSTQRYSYVNSIELTLFGVFGGLILTLILYNLMMYFNLKQPVFLAYVLHASLLLWFQYAFNGMIYFFDIGFDLLTITLSTWYIPYFMLAAQGVFAIVFFELHHRNRLLFYSMSTVVTLSAMIGLMFFYAYHDTDILLYTNYFLIVSFVFLLFYLAIGIYAVFKRYPGGSYYLFGEGVYIVALIYLSFVLAGQTPTGYASTIVPTAILIEMFAFSLALGSWVKKLRIENEETNQLVVDEARFTVIGKNIGMAVHQWKDPLSQLGSHILYLKAKEYEGEHFSEDTSKHINAMSNLIEHMKDTVNDLYDSCTNLKFYQQFYLYDAIDLANRFLKDRLTLTNVDLNSAVSKDIMVYGSKNALSNVLMTLIDNALYQFEIKSTLSPKIDISVDVTPDKITLRFEDNGGGISILHVSTIFDIKISSKDKNGAGMGLALAKLLVEKRLNGIIHAYNTAEGACFEIVIPNQTSLNG